MNHVVEQWQQLYQQIPLNGVSHHFAGMVRMPFLARYLETVLKYCPLGGRTCETGIGSGYGAIWLSLQGVQAEGIDYASGLVERARQVNNILDGQASFRRGDLFELYRQNTSRFAVIHHQGVLEHFCVPWIHAALAQQVACADTVVFSVPSVYYPFDPEFGDERLLPIEEWRYILAPFDVIELTYYGDPQLGGREQILCVLRGQEADSALHARMDVPDEPYPQGISAIVHTRNEARHIAACLETLQGWTDEIIVCDMESQDETVAIAQRYTDTIISHPLIANFDRARNVSAMHARYRWVFYLDADERVPPRLGPALREMVEKQGSEFEALQLPFRHCFAGRWMQCLSPGYKAPSLLKNGTFVYNARPHTGVQVDGRMARMPASDPELVLPHYSYDSLAHYLDKLNHYTETEAANMHRDGQPFHWRSAIEHFVRDFQAYYDLGASAQDGVHGFLYAFLSGFYRFEQHAKLYELRFREQQLHPSEMAVPESIEEVLEYALAVARQRPAPHTAEIRVDNTDPASASVAWSGPLYSPSGYGEESRHFLYALQEAGVSVAAQALAWRQDSLRLDEENLQRLRRLTERPAAPGFVHIQQDFAPGFTRHPQAGMVIGRTMFETDRLPTEWVRSCNRMDYIWVPSQFNRQTFAQSGVEASKLVVMPGCFDPAPFEQVIHPTGIVQDIALGECFVFLSIFDWTLHKGWDVLLHAFLEAFAGRADILLVLKVWSTLGYDSEAILGQAAELVRHEMDLDLLREPRVRFLFERLTQHELIALYQAADAFVLPSRGEGWGRPYMEAMACGLPTIGTNWSGNTAYMTKENSYLLNYTLQEVSEPGWREISTYQGHRWAEPSTRHLKELLCRVVEERGEAARIGQQAREQVAAQFSRAAVGTLMAREIARIQEERR